MNAPLPNDHQSLRDALQRDAARVPEQPFDAALHQTTMRRIRALSTTEAKAPWFASWPALASAVTVIAVLVTGAFWPSRPAPPAAAVAAVFPAPPRASILSYRIAADEGDTALFATLDHDAADLLPATSPVFNALQ